ncbi:unnamed protein product, partial [Nesidiocoris tenuis]
HRWQFVVVLKVHERLSVGRGVCREGTASRSPALHKINIGSRGLLRWSERTSFFYTALRSFRRTDGCLSDSRFFLSLFFT